MSWKNSFRALLAVAMTAWATELMGVAITPTSHSGNTYHNAYCQAAQAGGAPLVFLGDSITQYFKTSNGKTVWEANFGENSAHPAVCFGIAGDSVGGLWWRVENGELDGFTASEIVILIGTNNNKDNTAAEIVEGISNVVTAVRAKQPSAKIILNAILPKTSSQKGGDYEEEVSAINTALAGFTSTFSNLVFVNASAGFLNDDGTLKGDLFVDGLHPNAAGYEVWTAALLPHLSGSTPGTDEPTEEDEPSGEDDPPSGDEPSSDATVYHDEDGTPVAEAASEVSDTREEFAWGYKYQVLDGEENLYQVVVVTQAETAVTCDFPANQTIEYLLVGGGGGAGATTSGRAGAGGGAGAVIYDFMSFSAAARLAVTVGKGGTSKGKTSGTAAQATGESGGDTFFTIGETELRRAPGGGGGGYYGGDGVNSVGSGGGGGSGMTAGIHQEGTGTSAGAIGHNGAAGRGNQGAGGGGAGSDAVSLTANPTAASGFHGGDGLVYLITGEPKGYAAGGGGQYGHGGKVIINDEVVYIGGDYTYSSGVYQYENQPKPNTGSGAGSSGFSTPIIDNGADGVAIFRYQLAADERTPVAKPTLAETSCTYDGESHRQTLPANDGYTVTGTAGDWIEIGAYTLTVTLNEGYKWEDNSDDPLALTYRILGIPVAKPAFASASEPYDGEEHKQTLAANEGYTVTYSAESWIEPGDYSATVTLKQGYMWADESFAPLILNFVITQGPTETTGERVEGTAVSESWGESYLLADGGKCYQIVKVTQAGVAVNWTVPQGARVEYLLVGGGGGAGGTGSSHSGAGGGAGAVLTDFRSFPVATEVTLTVGKGGASKGTTGSAGEKGSDTTLAANGVEMLCAPGGGGGAYGNSSAAAGQDSVGSGGGGAKTGAGGKHLEGTGTSAGAIGYDGATAGSTGGAGGGGAGGVAPEMLSPVSGNGCDGGPGVVYCLTGEAAGYAAGGSGRFGRGGAVTINDETVRIGGDFGYYSQDFVGPLANSGSGAGSVGSDGKNLMPGADGVAILRYALKLPVMMNASVAIPDASTGVVEASAFVPWGGVNGAQCQLVLKYGKKSGEYTKEQVLTDTAALGELSGSGKLYKNKTGKWYAVLVARSSVGESAVSEEFELTSEKHPGIVILVK